MTSNNQQIYDSINHKLAIENQLNQEGRTEFGKTHTIHKLAVLSSHKLMGLVLKSPNCPDLSINDSNGRTALHLACERGDEKMVKILLESGAKVTSRDTNGYTPLHVCCQHNYVALINLLVEEFNAYVNDKSSLNKWTPIHIAAFYDSAEAILLMVTKFGALLTPRTNRWQTPLDLANLNKSRNASKILGTLDSQLNSLSLFDDWLHEDLIYEEAIALLESIGKYDGLFLITTNQSNKNNYNLVFFWQNCPYNYEISLNEQGGFQIGLGQIFKSLENLVDFHHKNKSSLPCLLNRSLNKDGFIVENILKTRIVRKTIMKAETIPGKLISISVLDVEITGMLGEGEFGLVYQGNYTNSRKLQIPVALKHLKAKEKSNDFFKEAKIICELKHPSIIQLYGICYDEKMIILEFAKLGSMNKFLKDRSMALGVDVMKMWVVQIARGMKYLESKCLIHRDLATRNVLLASLDQVKISDFGMARKLESDQVYIQSSEEKIPFRWYPLEALLRNEFTNKSDIWSYGITIWEILTAGEQPYQGLNYHQVLDFLKSGLRLSYPSNCPEMFRDLMKRSWQTSPKLRPTFAEISNFFDTNSGFQYRLPIEQRNEFLI